MARHASGENFPVALRLLPSRYRRHLVNLYCFARLTDDLGDEARDDQARDDQARDDEGRDDEAGDDEARDAAADRTQLRLKLLDELAADVARIYAGATAVSPVMRMMAETVRERGVPAKPLLDLIEANRQDQKVTRYRTFAELSRYCELSANPVGQIVLYIFGVATPDRMALSDSICTALQLAEHWQDVAEDLRNGRIYLPAEDMERYGCTEADLAEPTAGAAVRDLLRFETARTAALLDAGAPLVGTLHGAARLAVAGYVAGGRAALAAIGNQQFDVLKGTPRPGKPRLAAELARTYLAGR
ncbi:MAG: squalene synthase HpnC [Streptosporangiaceae bacterium]|nr:squalene synthase HpnC [Streptosporangiaceae bacterium]